MWAWFGVNGWEAVEEWVGSDRAALLSLPSPPGGCKSRKGQCAGLGGQCAGQGRAGGSVLLL